MAIVVPTSEIKDRGAGKLADLPRITREIPEAGIQIPVFFSKINFLTLEYKPFTVQYYIIKLNENLIHINYIKQQNYIKDHMQVNVFNLNTS